MVKNINWIDTDNRWSLKISIRLMIIIRRKKNVSQWLMLPIKNEKFLTYGLILSVVGMANSIDRYYQYRSFAGYILQYVRICIRTGIGVSPSDKIATWRYWFRLSRDVYVGNRSFASYTKTKTVKSDVWCLLTWLDDGDSQQDRNTWTRFRIRIALYFQTTINRIK